MSDDLQLDILAKVTSTLKGMDQIDDRLKKLETSTKKLNKTNADLQQQSVAGFKKQQAAGEEFNRSYTSGILKSGQATRDFQNQASTAFLKLKGDFNVMKGIGFGIGGVATAAITSVIGLAAAASRHIDAVQAKAAELAESSGDKGTDAIAAISGLTNVDQGKAAALAKNVEGVGTQDQINEFIKRVAVAQPDIDTAEFTKAVTTFAQTAILPGIGDRLIEDLKSSGRTKTSSADGLRQMATVSAGDPVGISVLQRKRELEIENIRLGGGDAARGEQLTALEAKNIELRRSARHAKADREEREINARGADNVGEAFRGKYGTVSRALVDRAIGVVDVFREGTADTRAGRKTAENTIQNAHSDNRPLRVEVINQPRAVDGGL